MDMLVDALTRHEALTVFLVTLAARVGVPVPAAPLLVVTGGLAASQRASLASRSPPTCSATACGTRPADISGTA